MNSLVFDIGKTHVKLHVLTPALITLESVQTDNQVMQGLYPAADVDAIWDWFCINARALCQRFAISDLCITTHGATAALIDRTRQNNGLVLPVCDYEYDGVGAYDDEYAALRPDFADSGSPDLPQGLNLGRQLYWQSRQHSAAFANATDILMYPQYWVWRITGKAASEVTSLGCHTDLWLPWTKRFSSLVDQCGWQRLFPPFEPAHAVAGTPLPSITSATGLPEDCRVRVGIHDSNASYYRYKHAMHGQPFSLCSTGTWSIVFDSSAEQQQLDGQRDMLANVDLTGTPVMTSRFMGGREYTLVCEALDNQPDAPCTAENIDALIIAGTLCLPGWMPGTGPCPDLQCAIQGELPPDVNGCALGTLYCALMLDLQLELVGSHADIIVEGAFLKNPLLLQLLAQLRPSQRVTASAETSAAIAGTALLTAFDQPGNTPELIKIAASTITSLHDYRARWRNCIH